ncbi:MAG: hypothetical protein KatS3mg033_0309 [Thermonema sp.]|uniref:DUF4197 domain-containing protein n=1 Tax=Thermonema sp. TaxID=2231181 RepID=UPI0021DCA5D6|nr:DUF4197 domain-containing protein [Thermonema sp.]GIV38509.1 MAG: hypothetical protein KatS3mg033_0309 [Thermonema sp.]
MQRTVIHVLLAAVFLGVSACATLQGISTQIDGWEGIGQQPLTEQEIAAGLKEALEVGISKGVEQLMKENGYYGNPSIKILLPPEAQEVESVIVRHVPQGQALIDKVVLKMNRAAEEAAKQAKPIFVDAIKQMTIVDARNILFGKADAATQYLRAKTYDRLFEAYYPQIREAMEKVGAQQAWQALAQPYNQLAASPLGSTVGASKTVPEDVSRYVTERALYGLFVKVAEEELKIREQATARITPLLQKVFGELDKR